MSIKVKILQQCSYCKGKAHLPFKEAVDAKGKTYMQYLPCPQCHGSGLSGKWIELTEFKQLLETSACPHEHVSRVGGHHFSAGEVWDDIREVCDDCCQALD